MEFKSNIDNEQEATNLNIEEPKKAVKKNRGEMSLFFKRTKLIKSLSCESNSGALTKCDTADMKDING